MSKTFCRFGLAALCLASTANVHSQSYEFQTNTSRLVLASDGTVTSLTEIPNGKERLARPGMPFVSVKKGSQSFLATSMVRNGDLYHVSFGTSGVTADYRITASPNYVIVELTAVTGSDIQELRLAQLTSIPVTSGVFLRVLWDNQFSICLMNLSKEVDSESGGAVTWASVYPTYGMIGEKVAIIAVPTPQFLNVVQQVEHDFNLPSPKIGGVWAKRSQDVQTSYLYVDMTEANADQMISYAKEAGMKYILVYEETWAASEGLYPINQANYPHGEAGLKEVVAKCHAAGLKVGMHMMTSLVGKADPMVRPVPSQGLLTDAQASLASNMDTTTTEVTATAPISFSNNGGDFGESSDVWIDNEIVHYSQISGTHLVRCVRGYSGTTPAPHRVGATIRHLVQQDNRYLVDFHSPLADTLAARISGLVNRVGFDMIYFDAGELNKVQGPYWFAVGAEQMKIWKGATRDLLMQGSGATSWTWHLFARGTCEDYAAVAVKEYLDREKIAVSLQAYRDAFVPAELGWTGLLSDTTDHPGTTPDEMEYYLVRMLALDLPESIQTTQAQMIANGRTNEMLSMMGEFEKLRLSGTVPASVRTQLESGEWHMTRPGEFHPIRYDEADLNVPGQSQFINQFGAQPLRFRLRVAPNLRAPHTAGNLVLLQTQQPQEVPPPASDDKLPGAMAAHVLLSESGASRQLLSGGVTTVSSPRTYDLTVHRALSLTLDVEGPAQGPAPVLNVQLQDLAGGLRNYYLPLSFRGAKTINLHAPDNKKMLANFRPAAANYSFKKALYTFDFSKVTGFNLRWAKYDHNCGVTARISSVEALSEQSGALTNTVVSVGNGSVVIPETLNTGDYAEYWADGQMRIFDHNGVLLRTVPVGKAPTLAAGQNQVQVKGAGFGSLRFTLITMGN